MEQILALLSPETRLRLELWMQEHPDEEPGHRESGSKPIAYPMEIIKDEACEKPWRSRNRRGVSNPFGN